MFFFILIKYVLNKPYFKKMVKFNRPSLIPISIKDQIVKQ